MSLRLVVLALVIAMTAGCSSMSKKDCQTADWYSYGYQDGQAGMAASKVNSYVQVCGKHDVGVSQADYISGHSQGIRLYCQPNTGYQLGLQGRSLPQVCPSDLAPAFSDAHTQGMTEFKIKRDETAAKKALQSALKAQSEAEEKLVAATASLYAKASNENNSQEQQALDVVNSDIQKAVTAQISAIGQLACASGDWYRAGQSDGLAGRSGGTYKRHERQCQSYHPKVDQGDYIQGQSAGIQNYCSYDNGVTLGQIGRPLSTLCQGMAARELKRGYEIGLVEFDQKVSIAGLKLRQQRLEKSVSQLKNQQSSLLAQLDNPDLSNALKLDYSRQLSGVKYDYDVQSQQLKSTTNELNCYIAEWDVLGYSSGERGEVFANPSLNCAAFGIKTNTQAFTEGYQQGLARYCTPANGQALGRLGQVYQNVCPKNLEAKFLQGYQPAFAAYQRAELKKQLTKELAQDEKRLKNLQTEIDVLGLGLEQAGITRAEKLKIINEMSALNREENKLIEESQKSSAHLQCLTDDWFGLGKQHGEQGMRSQLLTLQCARFGLQENSSDYRNGMARGLATWCVELRGYQNGEAGEPASDVCSRTSHGAYFYGYNRGAQALALKQEIDQLRLQKLDLLEAQSQLTKDIASLDERLLNTQLSPSKRREIIADKYSLQAQLARTEINIENVDKELMALGQ